MIPFVDAADLVPFGSLMPYEPDPEAADPPVPDAAAGDAEAQCVMWEDAARESDWAAAELTALTAVH